MFHSSRTITNPRPTRFRRIKRRPSTHEQDQGQDQPQDGVEPPSDAQGQVLSSEQVQDQEQPQYQEQAQDDTQDDQLTAPQLTPEDELERRAAKIASQLTTKDHLMTNVLARLRKGVSTRR